MKRKILVKIEDYKRYTDLHGNNKLDSTIEIYSNSQFPKFLNISEEVFEGRETKYEIVKEADDHILIRFKSTSNIEYRIDLFKEPNTNIWHIAFSLFDIDISNSNYHERTDKKESIDIISRIVWILKDIKRDVEYCIGATPDPIKNKIYEYLMRFITNWERRETNQYTLGWAIYFKL
jgi:hypothetical protein